MKEAFHELHFFGVYSAKGGSLNCYNIQNEAAVGIFINLIGVALVTDKTITLPWDLVNWL